MGYVIVAVRAPASTGVSRVVAAAAGKSVELARRPDGSFGGVVAVPPGPDTITVEAYAGAARAGAVQAVIEVRQGEAAQLAARISEPGPSAPAGGAAAATLAAPRNTAVVGDEVPLRAEAAAGTSPTWAWTSTPSTCGSFSSPAEASTTWKALAPGFCAVRATATGPGAVDSSTLTFAVRSRGKDSAYPLAVSPNGRYLTDQRGVPFLLKAEAAWLALVNLTAEEQEKYLADRAARGFNAVEVMLLNHDYTRGPNPTPPANRYGEEPFTKPGDFATPNDAYFDRAVAFVDRASAHGIAVLIAPVYLGYDGKEEGWWGPLTEPQNTRAVAAAFGRYLGSRFRDRKNVLWVAGGDYAPPPGSEGEARHLEILKGVKAAGAKQLWTGHWNVRHRGGISTDEALFAPDMDLNGVYQYATTFEDAMRAYDVTPPRPAFLLESTYEREHGGPFRPFRKDWWWAMLSGGAGTVWGNNFLWMCQTARGTYAADYSAADATISSWEAELDSPGTFESLRLHALLEGLPWQRLVPSGPRSGRPELVLQGQGGRSRRIASAATPEGDVLVAYVPPGRKRTRAFDLDMSGMRGPSRAAWFDPVTGEFIPVASAIPNSGAFRFHTPGQNGSGANDWVLLVDAR